MGLITRETALGVRMHGVTLTLETDHSGLLDYATRHLAGLAEAPIEVPDVVVRCAWSQGEWDPHENPFPSGDGLHVIGKRMLGRGDELIWLDTLRMKGLQLRFSREEDRFRCDVAYRFCPSQEKLRRFPSYEIKKYVSLMKYLVYFPLFWYLERFRGWDVLHASAIAAPRGGALIAGLAGAGKTTTCLALMGCGMALVSENVVFTDGRYAYPCPEPIRVDANALALLGEFPDGLVSMEFPEGLMEKTFFHVQGRRSAGFEPSIMLFPRFAPHRYLTPLDPDVAATKADAVNRLTRELDDYGWYSAALAMHWPDWNRSPERGASLRRLVGRLRCFELGIDRTAGVDAVVEDVLAALP